MSDNFEIREDVQIRRSSLPATIQRSKLSSFLINNSGGILKNEAQVDKVLLGFALIGIAISIYLLTGGPETPLPPPPSDA